MTSATDGRVRQALRALPRVDDVVAHAGPLVAAHGRAAVVDAVRAVLDDHRETIRAGAGGAPQAPSLHDTVCEVTQVLSRRAPRPPRRVVNATGVVVHTNLGRAPLSAAAVEAMVAAAGYCDLEYDLDTGGRGSRGAHVDGLLADLVGAPAATVVNNAAGALVLVVAALATGRQVVVSRGELIEIGGSFRLPDILAAAGTTLVEVGTTNRTRADDYLAGDDAALLLRMHPSNYRITGFTAAPTVAQLAEVAAQRGLPLVHDVGSGLLDPPGDGAPADWAGDEPTVRGSLRAGADLVLASGDKLLGGPQAGLIVGDADLVARTRRHPLARALRLDKTRIAALVATLAAHRAGGATPDLPVWRMLTTDVETLDRRCARLAAALTGAGRTAAVGTSRSVPGGGSAPGAGIEGPVVVVHPTDAEAVAARLRRHDPPVVARVEDDRLVVDLRTVDPADDPLLLRALRTC